MRLTSRDAIRTSIAITALAALLAATPAVAANRGIPINLGDTASSAIRPSGDVDTYVFDVFAGTSLTLTLIGSKKGTLDPEIMVLDPAGTEIDLTGFMKKKKQKITVKKLVLPDTGVYAVRVGGSPGSEGEYSLKTKGKPQKKLSMNDVALAAGGTVDFLFSAKTDTRVDLKVKADGASEATSVFNPMGDELAGQALSFTYSGNGASATLYMVGPLGNYGVTFGNAPDPVTLDISAKFKHAKLKKRKLEISPFEPIVTALDPVFGRPGAKVEVIGQNFQAGEVVVLFGDLVGKFPEVESDSLIEVQAPDGLGEVDVTVFNPDGQEGTLEKAWAFIAPPPEIGTITPVEGPDDGGTVVSVTGTSFEFVTEIELGGFLISGPLNIIDDNHLQFTTDAHTPGFATIVLRDRWFQTANEVAAFWFAARPRLDVVDPPAGTFKGGTIVNLNGADFRSDNQVFIDGAEVTPVTFVNGNRLQVTAPAHSKAVVNVMVRDIWARDSANIPFEFNDGNFRDRTGSIMPKNGDSHFGGDALALGDVDGDKDTDLVIGTKTPGDGTDPTRILLNNGSGSLRSATGDLDDSRGVKDLALGDLDGDGDLDLVLTTDGTYTGTGSYYYYKYVDIPTYFWLYSVPNSSTRILLNDGKGSFTGNSALIPEPFDKGVTLPPKKGVDLFQGTALALGDLDGDTDLDLVVTHNKNVGSTDWSGYLYSWGSYGSYYGSYQIFFYTGYKSDSRSTRVLLNDGKAKFTDGTAAGMPLVSAGDMFAGDDVLLGDVDGDKDLDILLTGDHANLRDSGKVEYVKGSKTRVLTNDGKAKFTDSTGTLFPGTKTGDDWSGTALAFGDLDGDGVDDLVVGLSRALTDGTNSLSSTRVFTGSASGSFTEATGTVLPSVRTDGQGEMWKATDLAIFDPDGDGDNDLIILDKAAVNVFNSATNKFDMQIPSTRFLLNGGSMPLTDVTLKSMPNPANTGDFYLGHAVVFGDLDGDSKLDLVISTILPTYLTDGKYPTRGLLFE